MHDPLADTADGVRFVYRHLLIAILLAVLGMALTLLLATTLKAWKTELHVPYVILEHLATALTIAGLWHVIGEFLVRRDFIRMTARSASDYKSASISVRDALSAQISDAKKSILERITFARRDGKLGLVDTFHDIGAFNFNEFIQHPVELTVVLGDGYNWVSNHIEALRDRIADPQKVTKIFLIHPDSKVQSALATKMHMEESVHRDRVLLTIKTLEAEAAPESRFYLFGHHSIPHQSVFLGDRLATAPYYFSRKMRNPPLFVFEKGSYVSKIQADLKDLEREALQIYPKTSVPAPGKASLNSGHADRIPPEHLPPTSR